jgi:hypothetical protein
MAIPAGMYLGQSNPYLVHYEDWLQQYRSGVDQLKRVADREWRYKKLQEAEEALIIRARLSTMELPTLRTDPVQTEEQKRNMKLWGRPDDPRLDITSEFYDPLKRHYNVPTDDGDNSNE